MCTSLCSLPGYPGWVCTPPYMPPLCTPGRCTPPVHGPYVHPTATCEGAVHAGMCSFDREVKGKRVPLRRVSWEAITDINDRKEAGTGAIP